MQPGTSPQVPIQSQDSEGEVEENVETPSDENSETVDENTAQSTGGDNNSQPPDQEDDDEEEEGKEDDDPNESEEEEDSEEVDENTVQSTQGKKTNQASSRVVISTSQVASWLQRGLKRGVLEDDDLEDMVKQPKPEKRAKQSNSETEDSKSGKKRKNPDFSSEEETVPQARRHVTRSGGRPAPMKHTDKDGPAITFKDGQRVNIAALGKSCKEASQVLANVYEELHESVIVPIGDLFNELAEGEEFTDGDRQIIQDCLVWPTPAKKGKVNKSGPEARTVVQTLPRYVPSDGSFSTATLDATHGAEVKPIGSKFSMDDVRSMVHFAKADVKGDANKWYLGATGTVIMGPGSALMNSNKAKATFLDRCNTTYPIAGGWKGGHIINGKWGGSGTCVVPLTSVGNSQHSGQFEGKIHKALDQLMRFYSMMHGADVKINIKDFEFGISVLVQVSSQAIDPNNLVGQFIPKGMICTAALWNRPTAADLEAIAKQSKYQREAGRDIFIGSLEDCLKSLDDLIEEANSGGVIQNTVNILG